MKKKQEWNKLKRMAIGNVMEVDSDVCKEKCDWYGTTHAKSFHWVVNPVKYLKNGMLK